MSSDRKSKKRKLSCTVLRDIPSPKDKCVDLNLVCQRYGLTDSGYNTATSVSFAGNNNASVNVMVVAQGSEVYNRIGRKILNKKLFLYYNFFPPLSTTSGVSSGPVIDVDLIYRVMVVFDYQPNNAATPLTYMSDIIQSLSVSGSVYTDSFIGANFNNSSRFDILYDKRHNLSIAPALIAAASVPLQIATIPTLPSVDLCIDLCSRPTLYSASTSSSGDINTGAVLVIVYCPHLQSKSSNYASFTWEASARLIYSDA